MSDELAQKIFDRIWMHRLVIKDWDESKHKRHNKGDKDGGQFTSDGSSSHAAATGQQDLPFPERQGRLPFSGVKPGRDPKAAREPNPLSGSLGDAAQPPSSKKTGPEPTRTQPTVSRGGSKTQPPEPVSTNRSKEHQDQIDRLPQGFAHYRVNGKPTLQLPSGREKTLQRDPEDALLEIRGQLQQWGHDPATVQPRDASRIPSARNRDGSFPAPAPAPAAQSQGEVRAAARSDELRRAARDYRRGVISVGQYNEIMNGDEAPPEPASGVKLHELPPEPQKLHSVKAIKPDDLKEVNEYQQHGIKKDAAANTPEFASKMAMQYEKLALNDSSGRKIKEFNEKAGLWAHYAENHEDAKSEDKFTSEPEESFDELMPLTKSTADVGGGGPSDWDEVDHHTRDHVESEIREELLNDDSWVQSQMESASENIDSDEVIRENIDDILEDVDWNDLDVGQKDVADKLETTIKSLINGDKKIIVGSGMSEEHEQEIRDTLGEELSIVPDTDKIDEIVNATISKLKESDDPNAVNLPDEDEIADLLQIDEDEAISQITDAYNSRKSWALRLVDPKMDEAAESACDADCLREAADNEVSNMSSDELFERGQQSGAIMGGDDDAEGTSPELEDMGVDDAASFVGAPDGTSVFVNGTSVSVTGPGGLDIDRTFGEDSDGKYVHADLFKVGSVHKGKGHEIFGQMVAQARAAGFSRIETHAAGNCGGYYNGYYTWAAFGYDMDLSEVYGVSKVQAAYPDAETVQDVMHSPGGRDFWYVYGSSMNDAKFDLSDGSRSMRSFQAYLNEKKRSE